MKQFQRVIRFLKKTLPPEYPVRVRRTNIANNLDGDCKLKDGQFFIRIDKTLPEYYAIDVLLHEFAHCLAWGKDDDHHGLNWGKAYSLVYRTFLEWNNKE